MGAKYDSSLYDANDLDAAYMEGYDDAIHKVMLKVKVCCPWCSDCLAVRATPISESANRHQHDMLVVRTIRNDSVTSDSNKCSFIKLLHTLVVFASSAVPYF